jgi:hypothetical protein
VDSGGGRYHLIRIFSPALLLFLTHMEACVLREVVQDKSDRWYYIYAWVTYMGVRCHRAQRADGTTVKE